MDIKELNKRQLILLTLLITFVVSIATGIVTVSLMNQAPKSVPQTINNVIQRTIEKVTTIQAPVIPSSGNTKEKEPTPLIGSGDAIISIYSLTPATSPNTLPVIPPVPLEEPKAFGKGVIISDMGLILVDSNILTDKEVYKVVLNKIDFDATIIKKFSNGFAILKITAKKQVDEKTTQGASAATPVIDKVQ